MNRPSTCAHTHPGARQVLKEVAERSLEAERQRPQHQDSSSDSSDDDSDDGGQQRQGQGQQAGR